MAYLIEALLFLLPIAGYAAWRRLHPGEEPPRIVLFLGLGVLVAVAGAAWYGLDRSMGRGTGYVPATLDGSGNVVPGRAERGVPGRADGGVPGRAEGGVPGRADGGVPGGAAPR